MTKTEAIGGTTSTPIRGTTSFLKIKKKGPHEEWTDGGPYDNDDVHRRLPIHHIDNERGIPYKHNETDCNPVVSNSGCMWRRIPNIEDTPT